MKLALNSFWLLLARLGAQALMIVFVGVVARGLGAAGLGQYAFLAALILIGNAFTTFGTDTLLIREVARTGRVQAAFVAAALWIQLGLSLLWIIGAAVIPNTSPATALALKVYSLALLPLAFYTVFTSLLRAHERMDVYLLLSLAVALLQTGGAALVLHLQNSLLALCLLLLAVQIIAAGLAGAACVFAIPNLTIHWRAAGSTIAAVARAALPLALLTTLAILSQRLNVLMLSALAGDAATGWFSAAARVVEGLKVGHYAVLGALLPALSRLAQPGQSRAAQTLRQALIRLLGLALALAVGVTLLAGPLTTLLYGPRFAPAVAALQVQVWSLLPYTFTATIALLLVTLGAEGLVLRGMLAGLAISFTLYALLIPRFGLPGACWGMLAGECAQAGIFLWLNTVQAQSLRARRSHPLETTPGEVASSRSSP